VINSAKVGYFICKRWSRPIRYAEYHLLYFKMCVLHCRMSWHCHFN